jgi:uncharacterized membrane protein
MHMLANQSVALQLAQGERQHALGDAVDIPLQRSPAHFRAGKAPAALRDGGSNCCIRPSGNETERGVVTYSSGWPLVTGRRDRKGGAMPRYVVLYLSTLVVLFPLDALWLGVIARDFYKSRLGNLLGDMQPVPALLFYAIYVIGIMVFANAPETATWRSALLYGALFGFFAYATYDLTNLATLRGWSATVVVLDIAWGIFVTATASALGFVIAGYFTRIA